MDHPRHFLVVDHEPATRLLLGNLLVGHFPGAVVHESQEGRHAVAIAAVEKLDAIIVHRSADMDMPALTRILQSIDATVPIVATSRLDCAPEALAAGAGYFVPSADWPQFGLIVARALERSDRGGRGGSTR